MQKIKLKIIKINNETENVKTLEFDKKIDFKAGQFLNLYLEKDGHGKPYTISSAPGENLRITVKKIGVFSGKLHNLKIGDIISADGPFGFLILDEVENNKDIVFVAGGIGITPFFSIIQDYLKIDNSKKMILFYSNRNLDSIIFKKELEKIKEKYQNFEIYHFLSREKQSQNLQNNIFLKRLEIKNIEQKINDITNYNYFICGSVSYVNDFWKGLKEKGVDEDNIFIEAFFQG